MQNHLEMTRQLAQSLLHGKGVNHDCQDPQLLETHLSWVVLLGPFAYKLKKPLDLGFVDYSKLDGRRHFCNQELLLNQRTAPDMYLAVVAIAGSPSSPIITQNRRQNGIFEYAVKMRRFPQFQLLSQWLSRGELDPAAMNTLATTIADFHQRLPPLYPDPFAVEDRVRGPARDNFLQLARLCGTADENVSAALSRVRDWEEDTFARLHAHFHQRHHNGHTRACHGDLHLNNIIFDGNRCQLFDCIEFSEQLAWIDTANDLAFTLMDLDNQQAQACSWHLLNDYLAITGDHELLPVLAYYRSYRAMVRAKVLALQADQLTKANNKKQQLQSRCTGYLNLADHYAKPGALGLVLVCGLSGSGKTFLARQLGPRCGFIHVRSDVERKRLFNLPISASSHAAGLDIYTALASEHTLTRLLAVTATCLEAGYGVIVDATFIRRTWRAAFFALAEQHHLRPVIVECQVSDAAARTRLAQRQGDASEADYAQYVQQQVRWEPFDADESRHLITVDTQDAAETSTALSRVQARLAG